MNTFLHWLLRKDFGAVVAYAKAHNDGDSRKDIEAAIKSAGDPEIAYKYARDVLQGPWEPAKEMIEKIKDEAKKFPLLKRYKDLVTQAKMSRIQPPLQALPPQPEGFSELPASAEVSPQVPGIQRRTFPGLY